LTPSGTGLIKAGKGLNMNSLPITNLSTLNGHNIYQYGNFTMNATQTLGATNTPTRIAIDTTTSGASGLTLASNRITVANAGYYECSWRGYVSRTGGSPQSWIWARINNVDVADSATSISVTTNVSEGVMVKATILKFNAGDILDFFWAADNVGAPLTYTAAITSPYARPSSVAFGVMMNIVA
jgi:hypothetical protein